MKPTEEVVSVYNKVTGVLREFTLTQWAMLPKTARLDWQQGTPPEAIGQDKAAQAPAAAMLPRSLDQQIANGVAAALKRLGVVIPQAETPEQVQARKIKEGVAETLRGLGMSEDAITKILNEDTGESGDAGKQVSVPIQKADPEIIKQVLDAASNETLKHTGVDNISASQADALKIEEIRDPMVVAQTAVGDKSAADALEVSKEISGSAETGNLDAETDELSELTAARKRYEELYPGQQAGKKQLETLQQAIKLKEDSAK